MVAAVMVIGASIQGCDGTVGMVMWWCDGGGGNGVSIIMIIAHECVIAGMAIDCRSGCGTVA